MKEMYIDEKDLNMYCIEPGNVEVGRQEYSVTYLKEKDNRLFCLVSALL